METPTRDHLAVVKHILWYVKGTTNFGCVYARGGEQAEKLHGYSDSDMAGDLDDLKSTSGVLFFYGPNPASWLS